MNHGGLPVACSSIAHPYIHGRILDGLWEVMEPSGWWKIVGGRWDTMYKVDGIAKIDIHCQSIC